MKTSENTVDMHLLVKALRQCNSLTRFNAMYIHDSGITQDLTNAGDRLLDRIDNIMLPKGGGLVEIREVNRHEACLEDE